MTSITNTFKEKAKRLHFLLILICFSFPSYADQSKPNVILFLTDDMGWGDAAVLGHPYLKTPNIDRFAREGSIYRNFHTNSGVCSPSRVGFMTSNFPGRLGVHAHFSKTKDNLRRKMPDFLDPAVPNLARTLQQNGYTTAHFGKWHLGTIPRGSNPENYPYPSDYGFDHAVNRYEMENELIDQGKLKPESRKYFRALSSQAMVDRALKFMGENKGKPMYINIWSLVPHNTLYPTDEELAVYADLEPDINDFSAPMQEFLKPLSKAELKKRMQIYCAAMTGLDKAFGNLMQGIKDMGQDEQTMVFFSSDNGADSFKFKKTRGGVGNNGQFRGRKRSILSGGVTTPFIARWPGKIAAGVADKESIISGVDWFPTICALTKTTMPSIDHDGEDISSLFLGQSSFDRSKPLFWERNSSTYNTDADREPSVAMRDGKWKFYVNEDGSGPQLYDLSQDIVERNNLDDEFPELVRSFSKRTLAWEASLPKEIPVAQWKPAPRPEPILVNLGHGQVSVPMRVSKDAKTDTGLCVELSEGAGNNKGMVTMPVDIEESGKYVVSAKYLAPNAAANSFFIKMDQSDFKKIDLEHKPDWNTSELRNDRKPLKFSLNKGQHTIAIKGREDGIKLDQIILQQVFY